MDLNLVNSIDEQKRLRELNMFFSRDFMVTIIDDKDNVLFHPCTISNFSVDSKKLFVTVYDLIVKENIEEILDNLIDGNIFKKCPRLKIVLTRLDITGIEIYRVVYSNCILKKYHGKNFTYKSNEPYQWYLEFSIGDKEIVKNNDYNYFVHKSDFALNNNETICKNDDTIKQKELAILKNSNKMLEDVVEEVKVKDSISEEIKNRVIKQVQNAQNENKKKANRYYGASLDSIDFNQLTRTLEKQIADLEDKIEKHTENDD